MAKRNRSRVIFTFVILAVALLMGILAVSWVLSHAWLIVVLGAFGALGYYVFRRSVLIGGRRTLL